MSLINDALRRAKQAQQKNPPPPADGPPIRPVEPAPHPSAAQRLLLALAALIVVVPASLFVWKSSQKSGSSQPSAVAVSASPTRPATAPEAALVSSAPRTESVAPMPEPANTQKPLAASAAITAAPPPSPAQIEPQPQPQAPSNAPAPAPEPPAPKPPPLKLQGILYRPPNSVAIVNGKTVGVGDRLGDALVLAITQSRVIVVVAGQTNELSLPQ